MTTIHTPILVRPIVEALVEPFKKYPLSSGRHFLVDCTFGGGGHTAAFMEAFASHAETKHHCVIGIDQDPLAIEKGKIRFQKELAEGRLELYHSRFGEISDLLKGKPILGLMADLGFSSDQLDNPERGLSFQSQGPLDMRLDPTRGQSCKELLTHISETELEKILLEFGEERFSRRIAAAIVSKRRSGQVPSTTQELVDVVVRALPANARHGRIHAATRTFQALRIAVNEELSELDRLLDHVILNVMVGGRVALLSFHSLEDRKVKQKFKGESKYDRIFQPLSKKPIQADEVETDLNPRARSAKLRIAERVRSE
ncbi:MAG: 16S rRNA (cytosine(1402)-N(4))-methyltransferase RsmH [Bdellovibrionia bacterium]